MSIWRDPDEETIDLYPGFVVHDGRVSGSITLGRSRLPIWCLLADMVHTGWPSVVASYGDTHGVTPSDMTGLLCNLLDHRGEFARLLLILADVERDNDEREHESRRAADRVPWWEWEPSRRRVVEQLHRCLAAIGSES